MNSCSREKCINVDLDYLEQVIYGAKLKLAELSEEKVKEHLYGFTCGPHLLDKFSKIVTYKTILENYWTTGYKQGCQCLDYKEIQSNVERLKKLIGIDCTSLPRRDLIIDESGKEAWVAHNPTCVSRERWEEFSYNICRDLNLEIKLVPQAVCNLAFEIVREIIPCDVLVAISVFNYACNLNLSVSRTIDECKLDFSILHERLPGCNLEFDIYHKLIECNLSFDIIQTVYECGLELTINSSGDPEVVGQLQNYALCNIGSGGVPATISLNAFQNIGLVTEDSIYYKNPVNFINNLLSDYK